MRTAWAGHDMLSMHIITQLSERPAHAVSIDGLILYCGWMTVPTIWDSKGTKFLWQGAGQSPAVSHIAKLHPVGQKTGEFLRKRGHLTGMT